MKTGILVSAIVAASLSVTPLASEAGEGKRGWHHGHHKHHDRGLHLGQRYRPSHRHYYGHRHWRHDPPYHRAGYLPPRYAYGPTYYAPPRYHRDSPIGIIVGGAIGGVLASELSRGDPLTTGVGAIAGGVIGHELAR